MTQQAHGAEFLLRRLRRAAAIPAAERSPDVSAFVKSVQLLREACDLLSVTSNRRPALQLDRADVRQKATLALLKTARADYIAPWAPICDREIGVHLQAWCSGLARVGDNDLSALLLQYKLLQIIDDSDVELVSRIVAAMIGQLETSARQQVISRELAQLTAAYPGQPLLSFNQLRYTCFWAIAQAVVLYGNAASTDPQHQRAAEPSVTRARAGRAQLAARVAASMLSLEPQNPKSYDVASSTEIAAAAAVGAAARSQHLVRSVELLLQGTQLARQQGNMFYTAYCGAAAVRHASKCARAHPASWQAAVTAFEGAEAAMRTCKRLLPAPWADGLEAAVQLAQQTVKNVQRQLQGQHLGGSVAGTSAELFVAQQEALAGMQRLSKCDGCEQEAVGLRRCGRCKVAQYCSADCQRKHWRLHKRECHEA